MVLWELTLATAYVLGLKRTYRIALRLQRKLLSQRFPRVRGFVYRRTRDVFSVAIRVHKEIQQRDIAIGKSVGNRVLRFLDRVRPQANIRGNASGTTSVPRIEHGRSSAGSKGASGSGRHARAVSKAEGATSSVDHVDRHHTVGLSRASVRSRITDGLSRFRQRPATRSLPVIALGLWWQPVRRQMEMVLPNRSVVDCIGWSSWHRLPASAAGQLQSFEVSRRMGSAAGSLYRPDIAGLIYRSEGVIRAFSPRQR